MRGKLRYETVPGLAQSPILRWTAQRFGHAQARIYGETLTRAIQALTDGPYVAGSRRRDEISKGFMTLHVARVGRRGRHFVLYRIAGASEPSTIDVLRLLHDSMDLVRHVGSARGRQADPERGPDPAALRLDVPETPRL